MLRFLFPRLTPSDQGYPLFDRIVEEARQPGWYLECGVPDTLDGRFAVLSTLTALTTLRLEAGGPEAQQASVTLTERFIDTMDVEHRELGLGDPSLGKTVRKLVGSLARRVGLWRERLAVEDWRGATEASLLRGDVTGPANVGGAEARLKAFWDQLGATADSALIDGKIR